jgi:arabinogalactan oligomer/maltooligosaccharide transport system permease protein
MKTVTKYLMIAAATIIGISIVAAIIFPIYVIIVSSLSPAVSLFTPFQPLPNPLTFRAYDSALFGSTGQFFLRLGNSLFVAFLSLALTLAFVIPASYALSRFRFAGRGTLLYGYFAFNQFAGGMGLSGLISLYAILSYLNLLDSLAALAIIYAAAGIPFNTWLLKTYFDTIPKDFDEAALVDGASYFDVIFRVLLPVAAPGIATVAVFSFMGSWGEFIIANTILGPSTYTFPVQLYMLLGSPSTNWNLFAAMAIMYALPIVIMYMFAQKYLQSGLAMGGVKR